MSVEPIPHRDVIGEENLARLRGIGYDRLARWSELLLSQCLVVDRVIESLTTHGAITSVAVGSNTTFVVAAGGFEGATNPSYSRLFRDSGIPAPLPAFACPDPRHRSSARTRGPSCAASLRAE
jgi:hypothetical protein